MNDNLDLWVGIDLGTQSAKVQVVDDRGTLLASAARDLTGSRPDAGWHEQDARHWVSAVRDAVTQSMSALDPAARRRVRGVATCSTSGTLAVVDPGGGISTPGIMYDDVRAASLVGEVMEAGPERWRRLGYRIQPSWALPKIVQLARSGLPRGSTVVHQTDVVSMAMTGHAVATDWSSALKSGYDLLELAWPHDALDALGVDVAILPTVVGPGTQLGTTNDDWERTTGMPAGTAVVSGMTDGCAAQLGAGALGVGDWHSVLGTTLVLKGVSADIVHDESGAVYSHRAPDDDLWLPGGASSVGAGVLGSVLGDVDLTGLGVAATALRRGGVPAVVYPLTGTGERFPMVRPDASGFALLGGRVRDLDGLLELDPAATLLSLFAGVACVERLCFDVLADRGAALDGRLSSSGGGTASALWTRIRADVLDQPIALPVSAEGALGMAILAAWSARRDVDSLASVALAMTRVDSIVEPSPEGVAQMADHYAAFRDAMQGRGLLPR